jgi:hypothetical protein
MALLTEAIEALAAYRLRLKEQGQTLHASVVERCIDVLRRLGR